MHDLDSHLARFAGSTIEDRSLDGPTSGEPAMAPMEQEDAEMYGPDMAPMMADYEVAGALHGGSIRMHVALFVPVATSLG